MNIEDLAGLITEDAYTKMCENRKPYIVAGVTLNPSQSKNQMFNTLREDSKFRNWAAYKITQQYQGAN